jgi:hypothetical protein
MKAASKAKKRRDFSLTTAWFGDGKTSELVLN